MLLVSAADRGSDPTGVMWPWRRIMGGTPVVMWRSEAPLSTISFNSSCRVGIPWLSFPILGRSSGLVTRGHAQDLFDGGHAFANLLQARLPQGLHPVGSPQLPQLHGGGTLEDSLLDVLSDEHDLVQGHAALVSGFTTGHASLPFVSLDGLALFGA